MRRGFTLLLIFAMLMMVLAGCTKKKVFEIDKDSKESTTSQESSKEEASKPAEEASKPAEEDAESPAEESAEEPQEESADEASAEETAVKSYRWEDITFELTDITEDVSQWSSQLKDPEGKWVIVTLTITDGKMESSHLNDILMNQEGVTLDGKVSGTITQSGVEIVDDQVYAVGKIEMFFDMPADYTPNLADVQIKEDVASASASEPAAAEEAGPAEVGTVDGIEAVSGNIYRPATGELAYRPSGDSGYFAVDGRLVAQTTIGIAVDPPGVLNYDLTLKTDAAKTVDGKIEVYKDGSLLATYVEANVELPAGDTVINACVNTEEETVCSGEYTVRFYINETLIMETVGTIE